ncbi:MAG: class I SAM-dependent methyltransferase [Halobacteriales archaeon]|nr:class I SAM-dependent methyltransferase [Halobacteriales archaeon]
MQAGRKLNLGSGSDIQPSAEGWSNMDIAPLPGVDTVHDFLRFPWPFADSTFAHVLARHVMEHIPHQVPGSDRDGFLLVVEELHRILQPGGTLEVISPHHRNPDAWCDPTHTRLIHEDSFEYFTGHPRFPPYYSKARFATVRKQTVRSLRIGRYTAWDFHERFKLWPPALPLLSKPGEIRITLRSEK